MMPVYALLLSWSAEVRQKRDGKYREEADRSDCSAGTAVEPRESRQDRSRRYQKKTAVFSLIRFYFSQKLRHDEDTKYSKLYNMTPHELAIKMIRDVLSQTGITATAGIGTNMYLAKIAMDITAKHMPADKDGVRIAELDEMSFRKQLWTHTPLTDFWMLGAGYSRRLHKLGLHTMGDIARCSIGKPDEFYN